MDRLDARFLHLDRFELREKVPLLEENRTVLCGDVRGKKPAANVLHYLDIDARGALLRDEDAFFGAAILFGDHHVLSDDEEFAGKVTGLGSVERRVGETFARTVRRDEVFDRREALLHA